jgi:hypothetical protein
LNIILIFEELCYEGGNYKQFIEAEIEKCFQLFCSAILAGLKHFPKVIFLFIQFTNTLMNFAIINFSIILKDFNL